MKGVDVEEFERCLCAPAWRSRHLITKTLDHRQNRDKGPDRRERGVLSIYVCVPAHAGFIWRKNGGGKAWKQVLIVQLGVMREVMRVWVSRAGLQVGLGGASGTQKLTVKKQLSKLSHRSPLWILTI